MNFIEEKIIKKDKLDKLAFRFPPEPNGYLHLGHAKSICLNFGLGEKYNSPCYLRFDDTNPVAEDKLFVDSIIDDVEWLGFKPADIRYTSDYFEFIFGCAVTLIKKGLAYVDDSSSEDIANLKGTLEKPGVNSPFRNRSVDENLLLFTGMRHGMFPEGFCTLRAKIDMSSPNMILRDPVLYRVIKKTHHHVGDKWKVFPMYDFAHPLSDYKEGISDSLCTLEFEVHRPLYNWILENCDLTGDLPEETEFARLNLTYTILSKRNLKRLVEEKYVNGWDDPRMPTISGLRNRGFTPNAIRDFCERISVTKAESLIDSALLDECLRNDLNKSSNRLMGVFDPIKVTITNWDKGHEWVEVENNPEDPSAGKRMVPFSGEVWIEREDFRINADKKYHRLKPGAEVRLKGAYVVKCTSFNVSPDGNVTEIFCTYDPDTKSGMPMERKVKGIIHWVSSAHAVNIEVREYDKLFLDSAPDKTFDDITKCLNPDSLRVNNRAFFEPEALNCKVGVPVQMMRKGYYVLDKDGMAFNSTVSLKEGWKG